MKAVITIGPGKSVVREIPEPSMNDDSVKVKLKYVGVCRSEHYDWMHNPNGGAFGHEPMGVIVEVGKNVRGFQVGDRISGLWGSSLPGTGGMVEYAVVDVNDSVLIKLPDDRRDEDMVLEPLACMVCAVSKVRCTMPGAKVCVVGCGYMGCGAISLLKLRGFYVVGVDLLESSRKNALTYGADEVYTPEEVLDRYIRPEKDNPILAGFEEVMEWGETNESLDLAINLTKMCGQLCVGAYHTGPKRMVDMQQLGVSDRAAEHASEGSGADPPIRAQRSRHDRPRRMEIHRHPHHGLPDQSVRPRHERSGHEIRAPHESAHQYGDGGRRAVSRLIRGLSMRRRNAENGDGAFSSVPVPVLPRRRARQSASYPAAPVRTVLSGRRYFSIFTASNWKTPSPRRTTSSVCQPPQRFSERKHSARVSRVSAFSSMVPASTLSR